MLTTGTDPRTLPGFLRNLRHLDLGPRVAAKLHAELVGTEPVQPVNAARVYVDAAMIVEQARATMLSYTGWHAVERTVRAMEKAARDGNT
ncbi:MAG: ATP/GTP-binding protein, partial [Actinomycetota bacterium]|nr:ATP/GTP-binding protein [Actinomycetota bacterium]